jgi:insertion element IS1 protein InsB
LRQLDPSTITVELREHLESVEEAEYDELWSFVRSKDQQRWLWYAIDHTTGKLLAYVFGDRKDGAFVHLKVLLQSFGITRFYTNNWGAYESHIEIEPEKHVIGKANTQKN